MKDETSFSFGAGLRAKNRYVIDPKTNQQTLDLVWNAGFFYDKENSLLTSLFISGLTDYTVDLNIYPGLLRIKDFSPGMWFVVRKNGNMIWGITTSYIPGISF